MMQSMWEGARQQLTLACAQLVLEAAIQHVGSVIGLGRHQRAYLLRGLSLLPLLLTLSAALSVPLSPAAAAAVGLAARSAAANGELDDAARGELCLAALGLSRLAACCSAALEVGDEGCCCCCLLGAADLLLLTPDLSCSPLRGA
jgi:hypothetical protein